MQVIIIALAMNSIPIAPPENEVDRWRLTAMSLVQGQGSIVGLNRKERESLSESIKKYAVEEEILDPRETKYMLIEMRYYYQGMDGLGQIVVQQDQNQWDTDLAMIQKRWRELKDTPKVADSDRFPPRHLITEALTFNRQLSQFLLAERFIQSPTQQDTSSAALSEIDYCYKIWDNMRDARCDFYYITTRREAMRRLIHMLGRENYFNNHWPSAIPTWRFREME